MPGAASGYLGNRVGLSTVRNADQIVVLDHGHVAEAGTHTSLVAGNGRYAALAA
jgi:ATP-binding cassette, subfamily B, bacterial